MLDDLLDQLQDNMSNQKQQQSNQSCNKPGSKNPNKNGKPKPSMGEMQKQLNDAIQQLKSGQKEGKSMSSELAKAAARQEMLRRGLKELQQTGSDGEKNQKASEELKKLSKAMEDTEKELLNGQLSEKTIQRQKEILTRLLEAENADRERDLDQKRKATEAKSQAKNYIPDYEKYLKLKQKQIELLQSIPPNLSPYYKKEVNEYFENIDK
jgi:chromosome segregation ATPase